jgi:hypothetical protein
MEWLKAIGLGILAFLAAIAGVCFMVFTMVLDIIFRALPVVVAIAAIAFFGHWVGWWILPMFV